MPAGFLYFQKKSLKPAGDVNIIKHLKQEAPESYVPKSLNPTINFLDQIVFEHWQMNKDFVERKPKYLMTYKQAQFTTNASTHTSKRFRKSVKIRGSTIKNPSRQRLANRLRQASQYSPSQTKDAEEGYSPGQKGHVKFAENIVSTTSGTYEKEKPIE